MPPSDGHWPTIFLLGAQKAASSSLFAPLVQHPLIADPTSAFNNDKETHFFHHHASNTSRLQIAYRRKFPCAWPVRGMDGTPSYLYDPERVIPRMIAARTISETTSFLVVLREPVARDWSMFRML